MTGQNRQRAISLVAPWFILGFAACADNEPSDLSHLLNQGTGGTSGTGGESGTGGASGTGGDGGTAGDGGTGGTSGTGGDAGSAGSAGTGGTSGTGGESGTGGASGTGGTGGTSGTGGAGGTGGTAASGGSGGGPQVCDPQGKDAVCVIFPGCYGYAECQPDGMAWGSCLPYEEICGDNIDNDCDGQIDEGCVLGCTVGQVGREVRYRYTMPGGNVAQHVSVFDEADDASGIPLPRPVACGDTWYDQAYAWGAGWDCDCPEVCYAVDQATVECIIHRPAGATLRINAFAVYVPPNDPTPGPDSLWACMDDAFNVSGTFQVWVDGNAYAPAKEVWPGVGQGKPPACRWVVKL
jgi:hypothetical protein